MLGPSGSGKTTLLNVIGAIEQATSGRIEVAGLDVAALDRGGRSDFRRTRIGFIFQFFNLVPTLTAGENVQLIAELTGADVEARTTRVFVSRMSSSRKIELISSTTCRGLARPLSDSLVPPK